jgi:hypothetical protein
MNTRSERIERRFRVPIIVAALLVIPVLILQGVTTHGGHLHAPWSVISAIGDWAIWLTFLGEIVAMLAVVSDRRAWLPSHVLGVAIIVLTPPLSPTVLQSGECFAFSGWCDSFASPRWSARFLPSRGFVTEGSCAELGMLACAYGRARRTAGNHVFSAAASSSARPASARRVLGVGSRTAAGRQSV